MEIADGASPHDDETLGQGRGDILAELSSIAYETAARFLHVVT